jgi:shikimate kinase
MEAKVQLIDKTDCIKATIVGDPAEDTKLIKCCVRHVIRHFRLARRFGVIVETNSEIPIARGLKSSSAAANAVVLATAAALGKNLSDREVLNLGVDSAIEAGVTITGAFDDACASYYGDIVITDNLRRRLIARRPVSSAVSVLLYVPEQRVYTGRLVTNRLRGIAPLARLAYRQARAGNYWDALTLNGLAYGVALGYDLTPAIEALKAGALASGLSGKGPAFTAIVTEESLGSVRDAWNSLEGEIIETKVNRKRAFVIRRET